MSVYLLHFEPSYKHAKHYLGYADDVAPRVYAHLHGRGARLTQVATAAGSAMILVRVWEGADRTMERRMKNASHVPQLCPICRGRPVQMPLLLGEPAYVPTNEAIINIVNDGEPVSEEQISLEDEAITREWEDYRADQEWLDHWM